MSPLDFALPDVLSEQSILFPGSGHDADKASATVADAGKVLGGGQLTVGHIDEVRVLEQVTQALMVFGGQPVVGLIAGANLVHQGHRAAGGNPVSYNPCL